jgi:putative NAD(P)-binding protein
MEPETDYLVVGGGASALAFTDVILRETDATVTIVDRRHAPGGHWNDAYPFVKLHQPSASYGVASRALGRDKKDTSGFNSGFYELASGTEITHYFHDLMQNEFLPTGRVDYHPMSDYTGNGEFVSLLSGERHKKKVKRKLVDGTVLGMEIPLTHQRKFEVADGVQCVPPNELTRAAPEFEHFTVLGAGKTAIDSVIWLLGNGTPPSSISWVLPRDPWFLNRAYFQPGISFFEKSVGGLATTYENIAAATSIDDLCTRMEEAGQWLRLDSSVWPTMFHAATVSEAETEQLRLVANPIRMGHVKRIELKKMILDQGEVCSKPGTLYVDCTARGIATGITNRNPVFSPTAISLKMVRMYQPTFSAALIGYIEANVENDAIKQQMTQSVPMTDTAADWVRAQIPNMANQYAWSRDEALYSWIAECRLDPVAKLVRSIGADDSEKQAIMSRLSGSTKSAVENLQSLSMNGI